MGSRRVTDSDSRLSADGSEKQLSSAFRYTEKFEELCPYYMAIGMSYDDYWNGDCWMAKFYREAFEQKRIFQNEKLWLQGVYIYEAILDSSPALNPLSKTHKPIEYRKSPIPITDMEERQKKEREEKALFDAQKDYMIRMTEQINAKFAGKEDKHNG